MDVEDMFNYILNTSADHYRAITNALNLIIGRIERLESDVNELSNKIMKIEMDNQSKLNDQ